MPVEGFEPSTPRGDLFLRQARIPFRHAGLGSSFRHSASTVSHRNKRTKRETKRVLRILQRYVLVNMLEAFVGVAEQMGELDILSSMGATESERDAVIGGFREGIRPR